LFSSFPSVGAALFIGSCIAFALPVSAQRAPVAALAFSPGGETLWHGGSKELIVRSTQDGAIQRRIPLDFPRVSSLAFNSDGRLVAAVGGTPGISGVGVLFDQKQENILARFTNFTDLATSVAFSSDMRFLAVASADHSVKVFQLRTGATGAERAYELEGHAGPVLAVAFSPTGRSVVTASADRSLKVWEPGTGQLIRSFNHHTEIVHALTFRPLEKDTDPPRPAYCASASDDHTVRIWQPETGRMVRIVRKHEGPVFAVVFSRDGSRLFSAGKEGFVRVIDAESDEILEQWRASDDWIYSLALSPNGATLATGDWVGQVKLWDVTVIPARLKTPQ
jgi:WD40 repeat protein